MITGGKLLNAKDSAQLACASAEERERLVAEIVRKLHAKRLNATRMRIRRLQIANSPDAALVINP